MESDGTPARRIRHGHHAFIPAGVLIGLGVGILVNYPGPGILIGLGLGFLASSFWRHEDSGPAETAPSCCNIKGKNWFMLLAGIFLILLGIGLVGAPLIVWPYLIAVFLIVVGVGFVVRGFYR